MADTGLYRPCSDPNSITLNLKVVSTLSADLLNRALEQLGRKPEVGGRLIGIESTERQKASVAVHKSKIAFR